MYAEDKKNIKANTENKRIDKKRRLISGVITLVFYLLVFVLLSFLGLPYQDPPPAERGVEISAGDLTDTGDALAGVTGGDVAQERESNFSPKDADNIATQNTEDSPITSKPTKTRENKKQPKTPTVENDAMFPGKKGARGKGQGSGSGFGQGENGIGGGGNGSNASGSGYSLNGRTAKSLPKPETNKKETGNVVVMIEVNPEGVVIRATAGVKGTTLMDSNIWRKCEQAAKKAKFSAKEDAPEKQRGTITYHFVY